MEVLHHIKLIVWDQPIESIRLSGGAQSRWFPFFYFFLPLGASVAYTATVPSSVSTAIKLNETLITCSSIIIGFLINMLVPLFNLTESKFPSTSDEERLQIADRRTEYRRMYYRIASSVIFLLVSLVLLILSSSISIRTGWTSSALGMSLDFDHLAGELSRTLIYFGFAITIENVILIFVSANALIHSGLK
jgi:hypothetical protein